MLREVAPIPLVLWVSAAALVHVAGGKASGEVAAAMGERSEILAFARQVRAGVRPGGSLGATQAEILPPEEPPETRDPAAAPLTTDGASDDAPELAPTPLPVARQDDPPPRAAAAPKPAPAAPPAAPTPPPKEAAEEGVAVPVSADGRIAVVQDVAKDQPDNPDAPRIADDANHVEKETMARMRAYNGEAAMTPGKTDSGPSDEPGNGDETQSGFVEASDDPGPHRGGAADGRSENGAAEPSPSPPRVAVAPGGGGQAGRAATPASPARQTGSGDASPPVATGSGGAWSLDPTGGEGDGRPAQIGSAGRAATPGLPGLPGQAGLPQLPGFGAGGPYNLDYSTFIGAVGGTGKLHEEARKAHDARLAKHAGSMLDGIDFQRYRAAVENYDPSVELGNQTSLNAARVPFATYINHIHNQLHPIFADDFLGSLDKLPADNQLNQKGLVTHLELVLDQKDGTILRLGVTKPSGVTAFDIAALKAVERSAPFGAAPDAIASPDGRVYLHWEFHRDPYYACTSRNASPFLLKNPPKKKGGGVPSLSPPEGPPASDQRVGQAVPGPILPLAE